MGRRRKENTKESRRFSYLVVRALNTAMQQTGKTQGQLAKIIGVNKNTLTNWRKGSTPNNKDFGKLLKFLGTLDPPITKGYFAEMSGYVDVDEFYKAIDEVKRLQDLINETIEKLYKARMALLEGEWYDQYRNFFDTRKPNNKEEPSADP